MKFCPYGQPGDVLWVREKFLVRPDDKFEYAATDYGKDNCMKWKPSIHMPKEACRIFLKVKNIRVERLQDINEGDAIAEGVLFFDDTLLGRRFKDYEADASGYGHPDHDYPTVGTAKESFFTLWQKINGPGSWNANPWVWVIEFERTTMPENFLK